EDGIRARNVTGVQTCALPISYHFWGPEQQPLPHNRPQGPCAHKERPRATMASRRKRRTGGGLRPPATAPCPTRRSFACTSTAISTREKNSWPRRCVERSVPEHVRLLPWMF